VFNPVSITDIIKELVAKTATAMGIAINYKFGTWRVINEETKNSSNDKFPLIAVLQGWTEIYEDDTLSINGLKILIAVRSTETDRAQTRNDENYIAQIFPIYKAFCEQIADSSWFLGYNANFKHVIKDWPNIGLDGGDRLLEDCLDGRMLEDIVLKVNLNTCLTPKSVCAYTPCPNGRIVDTLSIFKNVSLTGLATNVLTITINDYEFFVAPPTLPSPVIPQIDPGNGGPTDTMDNLTYSIDVALMANGFYIGTINFAGAQVQFYYVVFNGGISIHTSEIIQSLTPTFDCQEYFDTGFHSIGVSLDYSMLKRSFETSKLTGYELTLFGQSSLVQSFPPTDTVSNSVSRKTKYNEGIYQISQDAIIDSHTRLVNVSYLKTKCS